MFNRLFKKQDYRVLRRHRWMALCVGYEGEPYIVTTDGVTIIPLDDDNNVLFIIEPTRTDGRPVLYLPSGAVDDGDQSPADSANRELQEEIGYKAGRLDFLGQLNPLSRHAIWNNSIYLARDLMPYKLQGDESYNIPIERIPFADFEALIDAGRLTDASLIAGLYLARRFIESEVVERR